MMISSALMAICALLGWWLKIPDTGDTNHSLAFYSLIAIPFLGAGIGVVTGYRRMLALMPATSDGATPQEPRHLGDYCSPLVWATPIILALMSLAVGVYAASVVGFTTVRGSLSVLVIWLFTLGVIALCARAIATAPNALSTNNPITTQRANDFFRAQFIGRIFGSVSFISVISLYNSYQSWSDNFSLRSSGVMLWVIPISIVMGIALPYGSLGILIASESGRLGGRFTGWWWQRRHVQYEQAATAQEGE